MVKVARAEGGEMSLTESERLAWQQRLAAITCGATVAALMAVEPLKSATIADPISELTVAPEPVFVQEVVPEPRPIRTLTPPALVTIYTMRNYLPARSGIVAIGAAPVLPPIADAAAGKQ